MKNKTLKEGLALLGIGAAVVALALHPPRLLCRIYLAIEKAAAVFLGVMLALAGIAAPHTHPPAIHAARRFRACLADSRPGDLTNPSHQTCSTAGTNMRRQRQSPA